MIKNLYYIITNDGITAVIGGETHTITRDNPSFGQVKQAIAKHIRNTDATYIADLFRTANAVKRYTNGAIEVSADGSSLFFKGQEVHNVVVDRIIRFMSEGLPVGPLLRFLERLLANPSRRSIQELYTFLEHKALPICEDGCFLAYKGVKDDYTDVHSGTFSNKVGVTNSMSRSKVDDDFRRGCSFGFHVGSLEYATGWGPRTVICKIDPADVVSVPEDCNFQKLRTAKYTVVDDYHGALSDALHSSKRPYQSWRDVVLDEDEDDDFYDL